MSENEKIIDALKVVIILLAEAPTHTPNKDESSMCIHALTKTLGELVCTKYPIDNQWDFVD